MRSLQNGKKATKKLEMKICLSAVSDEDRETRAIIENSETQFWQCRSKIWKCPKPQPSKHLNAGTYYVPHSLRLEDKVLFMLTLRNELSNFRLQFKKRQEQYRPSWITDRISSIDRTKINLVSFLEFVSFHHISKKDAIFNVRHACLVGWCRMQEYGIQYSKGLSQALQQLHPLN